MSTVAITRKQCPNCSTWKSFNVFFTELFLPLPVFPCLNEKIDLEIRFIRLFGNLFEMAFNTLLIVSLSETRREHVFALDKRIVTLSLLLVALSPNVSSWRMLITFQDRISVILKSRKICDSSSPGTIDGTVIPSVSGIRGQSGSSNGKKKIPFQHLFNFIIKISRKWLLVYLLWRNVSVLPFARPRADATLDSRSRQTKELYSLLAIKKRKRLINNRSNNWNDNYLFIDGKFTFKINIHIAKHAYWDTT